MLVLQEMKAAESARAHALAVEVAELKQQLAVLQASDKLPSDLSQCTPRSISHDGSHQVTMHAAASPATAFSSPQLADVILHIENMHLAATFLQCARVRLLCFAAL